VYELRSAGLRLTPGKFSFFRDGLDIIAPLSESEGTRLWKRLDSCLAKILKRRFERYVFFLSLALAALVGLMVFLQVYVFPFTRLVVE